MSKLRKMLEGNGEGIEKLMRLIETQSLQTLMRWTTEYAALHLLPIYVKYVPDDDRPAQALAAGKAYLRGEIKPADAKPLFKLSVAAAQEAVQVPAAQAAARAVYSAVATAFTPTMSISIAYYGATAMAYDTLGLNDTAENYDRFAEQIFADQLAALQKIAVKNEPNPAKLKWEC